MVLSETLTEVDDIIEMELSPANAKIAETRPTFIIWKGYQRRSEVLAPLLGSETLFFPHMFRRKVLRPLDYVVKLIRTILHLARVRPPFVVIQAPPLFPAIAAIFTRTPYVVDVHNALLQSFWSKLPLSNTLVRRAACLIAHNSEIKTILAERFPRSRVCMIPDPVQLIRDNARPRDPRTLLVICSFDYDEPIRLLLDVVSALPEFTFTITADPQRLPRDLRTGLAASPNVRLTGFLSTEVYHSVLCSSKAAVVLTTMSAVQPSGACEALASNTPLILTKSALTEVLFGGWAVL